MLTINGLRRFYFLPHFHDMRCKAPRVAEIIRSRYHRDPFNGDVYIFMSKRYDKVKNIYPKEYFCPKGPNSDKCNITTNTRSIHHYAASWYTWKTRLVIFIRKVLGERFLTYLLKLK